MDANSVVGPLAIATFVLAAVAVWSILQTKKIHKKELKIKLLDEIEDWALSIQTSSLEIHIPVTGAVQPEIFKIGTEFNVLLKYSRIYTKNTYIKAIASAAFKGELLIDMIEETARILTGFLFLKGTASGMKDAKEAFMGDAIVEIENIEKRIVEGKKSDEMIREYGEALAYLANEILIRVGKIKANLLRSYPKIPLLKP